MSIKNVLHNRKMIVVTDYRGLKGAEQIKTLEQLAQIAKMSPTSVPFLSNFEGANIGPEYVNRVKALGRGHQTNTNRQALLGIKGLKNLLLKSYIALTGAKEIKAFDTETEAMDWLASGLS